MQPPQLMPVHEALPADLCRLDSPDNSFIFDQVFIDQIPFRLLSRVTTGQ